jgi:glycosyltransferase involved in cell wall biosynthesis
MARAIWQIAVNIEDRVAFSRSKTILFPFMGDRLGGSYISSIMLVRFLAQKGYRVVVVLHANGALAKRFRDHDKLPFSVIQIKGLKDNNRSRISLSVFSVLRNCYLLARFISNEKIDLIHTNDGRMHELWSLPARISRTPHIWHQRTRFSPSRRTSFFLNFSSAVISISKYVEKSLPTISIPSFIIPNAVEPPILQTETTKRERSRLSALAAHSNPYILGWFGTLRPLKRPMVFFQAVAELVEVHAIPLVAVVFGRDDGEFIESLGAQFPNLKVLNAIKYMGVVNDPLPVMAACDAIVSTSVDDGFGRTLIEAMAVGVPVVAARSGGHEEIIVDYENGLLVEPDNSTATADAVLTILTDSAIRQKLITNGQRSIATRYEPARHCLAISAIYDSLVRP